MKYLMVLRDLVIALLLFISGCFFFSQNLSLPWTVFCVAAILWAVIILLKLNISPFKPLGVNGTLSGYLGKGNAFSSKQTAYACIRMCFLLILLTLTGILITALFAAPRNIIPQAALLFLPLSLIGLFLSMYGILILLRGCGK